MRIEKARVLNSIVIHENGSAGEITAELVAPGVGYRNFILKVDASYGLATTSGLLTLKSGLTVICSKYIHGSGAIDFSELAGFSAVNENEGMTATLAAGPGLSTCFILGFTASTS